MNVQRLLTITPQEVMMRNAERLAVRERQRANLAVAGLKRVIGIAVNANKEWNPEIERVTTAIIIEAENVLREMDGRKQTQGVKQHWLHRAKSVWQLQVLALRSQVSKLRHMFVARLQSLKTFRLGKRTLYQ